MNKIKTNTIILIAVGLVVAAIAWKVFSNGNAAAATGNKKSNNNKNNNSGTGSAAGDTAAEGSGTSSFFGRK